MKPTDNHIDAEERKKPTKFIAILRITILFAFAFDLAACRSESSGTEETCFASASMKSWTANAAFDHTVLVFGETHGTRQAPAAFLNAVCSVAAADIVTIVGLELPESALSVAKEAVHTRQSEQTRALLRNSSFWTKARDGRSSVASFWLVEKLVRAEDLGKIRLVGFDRRITGREDFGQTAGKYLMRVLDESLHAEGVKEWRMLLLTGQTHADFRSGSSSLSNFFPSIGYRTLSIAMLSSGGNAWVCRGGVCGPSPIVSQGCHSSELAPSATQPLDKLRSSSTFCLGDASISAPMISTSSHQSK